MQAEREENKLSNNLVIFGGMWSLYHGNPIMTLYKEGSSCV